MKYRLISYLLIALVLFFTGCSSKKIDDSYLKKHHYNKTNNYTATQPSNLKIGYKFDDSLRQIKYFNVGNLELMNYFYIPYASRRTVKYHVYDFSKFLFDSIFQASFEKSVFLDKNQNFRGDYVCEIALSDKDVTRTEREGFTLILAGYYESSTTAYLNYNISCKGDYFNNFEELSTDMHFYINKDSEKEWKSFIASGRSKLKKLFSNSKSVHNAIDKIASDKRLSYENVYYAAALAKEKRFDIYNFLEYYEKLHSDLSNEEIFHVINFVNNNSPVHKKYLDKLNTSQKEFVYQKAIERKSFNTVKHLANENIDVNNTNKDVLADAIDAKAYDTIKALVESGYTPKESEIEKLNKAIFPQDNIHLTKEARDNKIRFNKTAYGLAKTFFHSNNYKHFKNPMQEVSFITEEIINNFLQMKDNPVTIPPKVEKPSLPEPVTLKKSKFESTKSFQNRVNDAKLQRKKEIELLQVEYRKKVEERNNIIEKYTEILNTRYAVVDLIKNAAINDALMYSFGGLYLDDPKYDADSEQMFATLISKRHKYSKTVVLKVPEGDYAADFYKNINNVPVTAVYHYDGTSIFLEDVHAVWKDVVCSSVKTPAKFIQKESLEVVIENKILIKDIEQKQNPNLMDSKLVNIEISETQNNKYNDDLPKLLEKAKAQPPSSTKWLFVIGAEDYYYTDPVLFSERSADIFVKTAKKAFGIKDSNVYENIGEKATAGAIITNMRNLLKNVKKGDIIYFYYSGHGIPARKSREPYILPIDIMPDYIAEGKEFSLNNILVKLSESEADKIIAFIDSCFSGVTDGKSVFKGVAASRLKPKKLTFDPSKMAVLTAGKSTQFSNMYQEKGHRLFSYYLIKSILKGRKELQTLYNEIYVEIRDKSFEMGGDTRIQEPQLVGQRNFSLY